MRKKTPEDRMITNLIKTISQNGLWKLGILALTFLYTVSAFAKNNCDTHASAINPANLAQSGIGGTGGTQSGIGGTGLHDGGTGGTGHPQGGIGGTGNTADDGGIGGTGIIGTITGFASICVNGIEIHYNQHTAISVDGRATTPRELAVGQVIAAHATGADRELAARSIAVVHAAVGPVSNLDEEKGEMQVLGQTVRIGKSLEHGNLSGIKTGDWVQISGHRFAGGAIAASRIDIIPPRAEASLNGHITKISPQGFEINGARIQPEGKLVPAELTQGMEVSVTGHWDGVHLQAQHVQTEPTRHSIGNVDHVVIEGYIHALSDKELNVNNRIVTLDSNTAIAGATRNDLRTDQRIQINGRPGADQRISSEQIEVKDEWPVQIQMQERSGNDQSDHNIREQKINSGHEPEAKTMQSDKSGKNHGNGHDSGTSGELIDGNSGKDRGHISGSGGHSGSSSGSKPETATPQSDKSGHNSGSGRDLSVTGDSIKDTGSHSGKDHAAESNILSEDAPAPFGSEQKLDHPVSSGRDHHAETPQHPREQNLPDHAIIDKPEKPVELHSPERITDHRDTVRDIDIPNRGHDHGGHHDRHFDR